MNADVTRYGGGEMTFDSAELFRNAPRSEQDAAYWLTVRGNLLPAPFAASVGVQREDRADGSVRFAAMDSGRADRAWDGYAC